MKKILLLQICLIIAAACTAQTNYTRFGGSNSFNAKYKLTVVFDEKKGIMSVTSNASFMNVNLLSFTRKQFAVRKGNSYNKYFPAKVRTFTYDMKAKGLKDRYYYWLKLITEDGTLEEFTFKRKDDAPAVNEAAQDAEGIESVDDTESSKYEFYEQSMRDLAAGKVSKEAAGSGTEIKTNITCGSGKTKVTKALMKMDGVKRVLIDIKTGKMNLYYSSDGTSYATILDTISENGFSADGQPAKPGSSNPCAGKN